MVTKTKDLKQDGKIGKLSYSLLKLKKKQILDQFKNKFFHHPILLRLFMCVKIKGGCVKPPIPILKSKETLLEALKLAQK